MSVLVTCPNGHRFPVNLKKHLNRRERYCPRCKAPFNLRPKFWFSPNPDWIAQKEGYRNAQDKKRAQEEAAERMAQLFGMFGRGGRRGRKPKPTP
jgi:hypothetical protein